MNERPPDKPSSTSDRPRSYWPRKNGAIDVTTQRFAVPISGFVAVVAVTCAAAVAWTKIPDKESVRNIANEASRQTAEKQDAKYGDQNRQTSERLIKVEAKINQQSKDIDRMGRSLDGVISLLAGSVANDRSQPIETRRKALRVKRNVAAGTDPFAGTDLATGGE